MKLPDVIVMFGVICLDPDIAASIVKTLTKRTKTPAHALQVTEFTAAMLAPYDVIVKVECGHADCRLSETLLFGEVDELVESIAGAGDIVATATVKHPASIPVLTMRAVSAKLSLIDMRSRYFAELAEYLKKLEYDTFIKKAAVLAVQARNLRGPTFEYVAEILAPALADADASTHFHVLALIARHLGRDLNAAVIMLPDGKYRVIKNLLLAKSGARSKIYEMVRCYNIHGYDKTMPPYEFDIKFRSNVTEEGLVYQYCNAVSHQYSGFFSVMKIFPTEIVEYCDLAKYDSSELIDKAGRGQLDSTLAGAGVKAGRFMSELSKQPDRGLLHRLEIITALL